MCTFSFHPSADGFYLAFNRDEQRARALASPPNFFPTPQGQALYPHEPNGGTWIGINTFGLTFVLLNWYEKAPVCIPAKTSRGELIPLLLKTSDLFQAAQTLEREADSNYDPFRLFGLSGLARTLIEWRWDGLTLAQHSHSWSAQHAFSSRFDEPTVTQIRAKTVQAARQNPDAETLSWLRLLHRSHAPHAGPHSICMHRADAVTVSYTELVVTPQVAQMRYQPGSPCASAPSFAQQLQLTAHTLLA